MVPVTFSNTGTHPSVTDIVIFLVSVDQLYSVADMFSLFPIVKVLNCCAVSKITNDEGM